MTPPEIALLLLMSALLLKVLVPGFLRQLPLSVVVAATLVGFVLHLIMGGARWQLTPAYLVLLVLLLASLKKARP